MLTFAFGLYKVLVIIFPILTESPVCDVDGIFKGVTGRTLELNKIKLKICFYAIQLKNLFTHIQDHISNASSENS